MKKIFIGASALLIVIMTAPLFAAFETYVINVKAQIENALTVDPEQIDFGAVFPQEYLEKNLKISLSQTFKSTSRVDDIEYVIKQKPKCWNNDAENPVYKPVHYATGLCPQGFTEMATLCAYLSKTDGDPDDQNDTGVNSYFQGQTCQSPDPDIASGYLSKLQNDTEDLWVIDLKVPPISGYVGSDWPAGCPVVAAEDYYGCDLWVEITSVSYKTHCGDNTKQTPNDDGEQEQCDGLDGVPAGYRCSSACVVEQIPVCEAGATKSCNTGEYGICGAGTATCVNGQWGACVRDANPTQTTEAGLCADSIDNDCDNLVDNNDPDCYECNPDETQGCNTGLEGICEDGARTCQTNGTWGSCVQNQPSTTENCSNQLDDDCDGKIDNVDDNCWQCAPDQTETCSTGNLGICAAGTKTCEHGFWGSCEQNQPPVAENCSNQLDDDCDGYTDALDNNCWECAPGDTRACQTGQPGICSQGHNVCSYGFWGSECIADQESLPEDCNNGQDDDCNGLADNDDPECKIACVDKADVMLVLDRSGSIDASELQTLKNAAKSFVQALTPSADGFHFGQTSFSTYAALNQHLTGVESSIYAAIDSLTSGAYTNLYHGIYLANQELKDTNTTFERPEVQDFMVIITDGMPNRPTDAATAQVLAAGAANDARAAGIKIYVLGVGTELDENYLKDYIANSTGQYYPVSSYDDLAATLASMTQCE